jgi:hypothetical protein
MYPNLNLTHQLKLFVPGSKDTSIRHGTSDNSVGQWTSDVSNGMADRDERDISEREMVQNPENYI